MEYAYQHSVKQWWLSITAGIIYILLGLWVLLGPIKSYSGLKPLFIMGFGVIGLLNIYYAINNRKKLGYWAWTLMAGLVCLIVTILLVMAAEITSFISTYVGFALIFSAVVGIGFSTYLASNKVRNWGLVLILSLIGLILSFLLVAEEFEPMIFTGVAFLSVGFAEIGVTWELRRYKNLFGEDTEEAA